MSVESILRGHSIAHNSIQKSFALSSIEPQYLTLKTFLKNHNQDITSKFWGIEDDPKYLDRKKKKIDIYKKYEFPLIELSNSEINNLEEVLTRKLIQHKISLK